MANVIIPDAPEFSEILRIIETKDLVHADVVNPLFRTLLCEDSESKRRDHSKRNSANHRKYRRASE